MFGRSLAQDGLGAPTVLGIRFGLGSVARFALLAATGRPVAPVPGERLRAFALGAVGYAVESSLFFAGLQRGTAAAVTLLFYAYPAIVVLADIATGQARPTPRLLAGLVLAASGVAVVVAAGGDVDITGAGIACALGAALAFSVYLMAGARLIRRTEPPVTAAWVTAGAALSLLTRGVVTAGLDSPAGHWPALVGNGLATAAAFALLFAALPLLGAGRTAVVMTFEAFAAAGLAALFLDESLGAAQLLGGIAIVGGAMLVTSTGEAAEPVPEL